MFTLVLATFFGVSAVNSQPMPLAVSQPPSTNRLVWTDGGETNRIKVGTKPGVYYTNFVTTAPLVGTNRQFLIPGLTNGSIYYAVIESIYPSATVPSYEVAWIAGIGTTSAPPANIQCSEVAISFFASTNVGYTVSFSTNLSNWSFMRFVTGNNSFVVITNSTLNRSRRYYRVTTP